jgi:hypothetical protein
MKKQKINRKIKKQESPKPRKIEPMDSLEAYHRGIMSYSSLDSIDRKILEEQA